MKKTNLYQNNFIAGVRMLMAKRDMESLKDAAVFLKINYQALYKIMDKSNEPRATHGITLCNKAGYSANWLFLNKGEIYFNDEVDKLNIIEQIKALRSEVSGKKVR